MSVLFAPSTHRRAATTTRRRAVAIATATVATLTAAPAMAAPADATEPWVLVHTATGERIDLTDVINDPAYADVDVDAVLHNVSAELRAAGSPVALTLSLIHI